MNKVYQLSFQHLVRPDYTMAEDTSNLGAKQLKLSKDYRDLEKFRVGQPL